MNQARSRTFGPTMAGVKSLSTRLVLAVATATLLVGCGGSDSDSDGSDPSSSSASADSSTETSAEPASGEEVSTDDFSFTAPEGWKDATGQNAAAGITPEAQYVEGDPQGFATNLNVVREPNGFEGSSEQYAEANIEAITSGGYESVEKQGTFGDFVVVSAAGNQNGTAFLLRQYYAARDGQGWVVTFTYPEGTSEADQTELAESVMQTWKWA